MSLKPPATIAEEPTNFLSCGKCFAEISPGKPHRCSEAGAVSVLAERSKRIGVNFGNEDSRAYQRVASQLTKHQMEEEGIPRGESFQMATGRNDAYCCNCCAIVHRI